MRKSVFIELAEKILIEKQKPLSAREIWEIAKNKGYDKELKTKGKTPNATLSAILILEQRKKNPAIIKVGEKPIKYNLRDLILTSQEKNEEIPPKSLIEFKEKDLHPFLTFFVYNNLKVYTKTIDHLKTPKREYSEWLHPDMVGCYFPIGIWDEEVLDFSKEIKEIPIKLYSFEIKKELNFGNLRASFFQTVSNSSWANEGYLVTALIDDNETFLSELRRLTSSFGIGIIKLDIEDPDSSEIVFPAKFKEFIDWDTINKLMINSDFKDFIKRVKNDISSQEIRMEKYDKVLEIETLKKSLEI
jgi:hypothetical protein